MRRQSVMPPRLGLLKILFYLFGIAHVLFGVAGTLFPAEFFALLPPWPPFHTGQIQIAGVFDLSLAVLFLIAASDLQRYLPMACWVGATAEVGHALVRIGHIVVGDDPREDLIAPLLMLGFGIALIAVGLSTAAAQSHEHSSAD